MAKARNGLSDKQRAWLNAYVGEAKWNASEAARIAGYADPQGAGYDCRHHPAVQEALRKLLDGQAMDAAECLQRLADQARGAGEYITSEIVETGYGKQQFVSVDWERLTADGKRHLVTGVKYGRGGAEFTFTDPQAALALIGRHHKLFVDQIEHRDLTARADQLDLTKLSPEELNDLERLLDKAAEPAGGPSGEVPAKP